MLTLPKTKTKNRLRNINIAISYHNTKRTAADVGREFGLSGSRIQQIHHKLIRHISRDMGLNNIYFYQQPINHCQEINRMLVIYKDLLEENELKTEVTLKDADGKQAVVLSTCNEFEFVSITLLDGLNTNEVSIEELKAALRKLSAK